MVTLPDNATLIEAAMLLRNGTDLMVVCDTANTLPGVVSKTDVVKQISKYHGASCMATLATAMTRDVLHCSATEPLVEVWTA